MPEVHWAGLVQPWPLATTARQAWAGPQKVPAGQSALAAQVLEQVPCWSQMLERHWAGAWQAWPSGRPQVPAWQMPPAHWVSAVQLAPPAALGTQVPLTQALVARQFASLPQVVPQAPPLQVADRQVEALVQLPGLAVPHFPSPPQTPEAHWEAAVQVPPLGSAAAQAPPRQANPVAQLLSPVQVAEQRWATQEPLRQVSPLLHPVSSGWPQKPSPPHWPARQLAEVVQGPPLGTPHTPAVHTPLTQALAEAQGEPLGAPQVPPWQSPLRHTPSEAQLPPLGRPHWPSAPQVPDRHWVPEVQVRALGRPQRSSAGSHTPPTHTARATVPLQVPPPCIESLGMGVPAGSLEAVQVRVGWSQ